MLSAMKLPSMLLAAGVMLSGMSARSEEAPGGSFEKDREAILKMSGDFKVTFHFHETLSLKDGYAVKEKAYDEDAHETVKVVEDTGKKIVLQHLLQAGGHVVKHWAQTWTYEDAQLLEFTGSRTWVVRELPKDQVKGTWTQRVTEVTDEPRYEGSGRWIHQGELSEWTSGLSNRPLPRREYTKRDDYDLLLVTNRHAVTANAWYHEQDNTKQVKREGASYPLCREFGLNRYERVSDFDFTPANDYWTKTHGFWKDVRGAWDSALEGHPEIRLKDKDSSKVFHAAIEGFTQRTLKGEKVAPEEISKALKDYVVSPASAKQ